MKSYQHQDPIHNSLIIYANDEQMIQILSGRICLQGAETLGKSIQISEIKSFRNCKNNWKLSNPQYLPEPDQNFQPRNQQSISYHLKLRINKNLRQLSINLICLFFLELEKQCYSLFQRSE